MRLIAELSMPNNNSWNGRWSGENDKHTIAVNITPKKADGLIGNYYYNFGDGWGASVTIRKPKPRERVSGKFCGYNWMVDSIKMFGEILNTEQRKEKLDNK
jgi:hypothetical protein